MVYLGGRYIRPVVNKAEFLGAFQNSYGRFIFSEIWHGPIGIDIALARQVTDEWHPEVYCLVQWQVLKNTSDSCWGAR